MVTRPQQGQQHKRKGISTALRIAGIVMIALTIFEIQSSHIPAKAAPPTSPAIGLSRIPTAPKAPSGTPGIYVGAFATSWLANLTPITTFEQDAKKPVSIIMWYQGWGAHDSSQLFQTSWMDNVRNHGSIPSISWEPWDYTLQTPISAYSLKNIIAGKFDAYITQWALASKAWGHPYFLRFAAEMNGNWFPWSEGVNGNTKGQFVQAWQHVHNIFTSLGATNVTWVWSPNMDYSGSTSLKELYPGSSYVDWVGIDGYNWSTVHNHHWQTFTQVFLPTYNDIMSMNTRKPIMIGETASAPIGGNKAAWITDAFTNALPNTFPQIRAFVWFNVNKETDWRIETAQAAFASAMSSIRYVSNQFATLNTSPIPVPPTFATPKGSGH